MRLGLTSGYVNIDLPREENFYDQVFLGDMGVYFSASENLDLGVRANSTTMFSVCGKYQIAGTKQSLLAVSVGGEAGAYLGYVFLDQTAYSTGTALYTSVHPRPNLAFTLSPRYYSLVIKDNNNWNARPSKYDFVGYTGGIVLGQEYQVVVEVAQMVGNAPFTFNSRTLLSLGFNINFVKKEKKAKPTISP